MNPPDRVPGGLPVEDFLREHWQKKPLLIREAFPDFEAPLTPDELAGLALEAAADSRLILERGGVHPWELRYGPFEEADFAGLPESHWTLLVQEVDRWVPKAAKLLERFLFVPGWRLDDLMVSFAPDGGSVGAHVDNYDVFLLQAIGRREWRIGREPVADATLIANIDVSILADFEPDDVMVLEPGDLLYLPPRIAHHGIAVGDCMTLSIGFRAPSRIELLTSLLDRAIEAADPGDRYSDPDLEAPDHPGRIGTDAVQRVCRELREALPDKLVARWFGMLVTELTRGEIHPPPSANWTGEKVAEAVRAGGALQRIAPNRIAFIEHDDGRARLFMHGEEIPLRADLAYAANILADRRPLDAETLREALLDEGFRDLMADLVNAGHLEVWEQE